MSDSPKDPVDRIFDLFFRFVATAVVGVIVSAGLAIFLVYMWLTT